MTLMFKQGRIARQIKKLLTVATHCSLLVKFDNSRLVAADEAERRYSYRFKVKRMCLKVKSC